MSLKTLFNHKAVAFEPIQDDDDELTQAIKRDPVFHDNHWDLHEDVDGEALEKFWNEAAEQSASEEA